MSDQTTTIPPLSIRLTQKVVGLLVWAGALYTTSFLHQVDQLSFATICAPNGCAPPLNALLGYHLFWLVLIAPLLIGITLSMVTKQGDRFSNWLILGGILGAVAVFVWSTFEWYSDSGILQESLQAGFFTLVTTTDIPVMQIAISGFLAKMTIAWHSKLSRTDRFGSSLASDPLNETAEQATI